MSYNAQNSHSTTKNYSAPNVNGAKTEKLWCTVTFSIPMISGEEMLLVWSKFLNLCSLFPPLPAIQEPHSLNSLSILPHFGLQHPWYVSAGYKFQFQRHVTHVLSAEHSSSFGKIQCAWGKVLNARAACASAPRAPSRPDGRGSCCPPGTRAPHGQSVSMSPRTPTMARRLDLKNGAGPAVAWPQPPRKAASSLIESQNGMERESIAGCTRGCIWERLPTSTSSAARARKPKPGASVGTATPGTG